MGDTRVLFDDILEDKIKIEPVNKEKIKQVKQEWNRVSKPIDSFGNFENIHSKIAAIQGFDAPDLYHPRLIVCCGDHGIVEEGVSQADQDVTRICATNI
ncbi:MAG: nicotinate-nucleotide--dimethylbenzimidazole phosphoribosyltransferase, partial [Pseudobutyrivibrio sp.]|nr:nicotinate-nucleotide--dimethylbenzimidazole phosphoribosyltransferase [Pseudobutyrivibrio sp.]